MAEPGCLSRLRSWPAAYLEGWTASTSGGGFALRRFAQQVWQLGDVEGDPLDASAPPTTMTASAINAAVLIPSLRDACPAPPSHLTAIRAR
jgi:hypothetical protein